MLLYGRFDKNGKNWAQYVVTKRRRYNGKYEICIFMMLPEEILKNLKRFNELFDRWDIRPERIVGILGSWYPSMDLVDSYRNSGLVGGTYCYRILTDYPSKYEDIIERKLK